MKSIARLLAFLSMAASSLLYVRIGHPINPLRGTLWILRLLAEALTPFTALSGAVAGHWACWRARLWLSSLHCSASWRQSVMCGR
jgi:hypothetical protein